MPAPFDATTPKPTIATAYVLPNGMVMAFDEHGQTLSEYQGAIDEVEPRIREVSSVVIQEATWRDLAGF